MTSHNVVMVATVTMRAAVLLSLSLVDAVVVAAAPPVPAWLSICCYTPSFVCHAVSKGNETKGK